MPAVVKKSKAAPAKKSPADKGVKKFVSESLQKRKPKGGGQNKKSPRQKKRGVLYIKHLPHGFFEEQLRGYFSQFGAITRLRLARSKRTLGSKGYAFIEFRYPEVAEIAADAMNNYLMFKNIIKTRFIPPTDIRHDYFRSSVSKVKRDGEKVFTSKTIEARAAIVQNTNKLMTTEDEKKRTAKIGSKINKAKKQLADLGVEYDVDELAQNMGDEVMQAAENSKPKTIANVELASEDEADDTFNPENVDIDSEDDFEDFEYASDNSDDEDAEVTIDEDKVQEAVKTARKASKTATIPDIPQNPKRKLAPVAEPTSPAKKQKAAKKGKENKQVEEVKVKPAKKVVEKKVKPVVEKKVKPVKAVEPTPAPTKVSKRNAAKKEAAPVVEASKPTQKPKKTKAAAKTVDLPVVPKADKVEAPAAAPKQKNAKKVPVTKASPPVSKKPVAKGKKAQKPESPVKSAPAPKAQKKEKKAAVPVSSPSPVKKTKKLAGVEKKKPAKVADKKLKLAAELVSNGADVVKVVKGKDIKKKSKK